MIRFQRIGRRNQAAFRIVVVEKARAAKSERVSDRVGTYNPHSKAVTLAEDRIKDWISKGAQPTDTVRNLLITKGIIAGKKVNALPSRVAKKVEAPAEQIPASASPVSEESIEVSEEAEATEAPATDKTPVE